MPWVLSVLSSGLLILSIALLVRNISRRKQAEQARRESERRYQALLESAGDVIRTLQIQHTGEAQKSESIEGLQPERCIADPQGVSSEIFIQTFRPLSKRNAYVPSFNISRTSSGS
jgi:PAS domain-containing protein